MTIRIKKTNKFLLMNNKLMAVKDYKVWIDRLIKKADKFNHNNPHIQLELDKKLFPNTKKMITKLENK